MNEQFKMSDKFFVYQPDGEDCGDYVAFNGAYGESILNDEECVKMLNGFNNTCAKQAEQIKMMRDALLEIDRLPASRFDEARCIAYVALSAAEQK
jgi:hypothetical protein